MHDSVWAGGDAYLCSALFDEVSMVPLPPLPPASELGLKPRARDAVKAFREMLARWHVFARTATVAELLTRVVEDTGYEKHLLGKTFDDDGIGGGRRRRDNVQQLLVLASEPPAVPADGTGAGVVPPPLRGRAALSHFLEEAALNSASDSAEKTAAPDAVRLLTMHSAKGMEFNAVFCIGLEDDIIPSKRARIDDAQRSGLATAALEEERRLFYVAVTRAKRLLYLCRNNCPRAFPASSGEPSRFLLDVKAALGTDENMAVARQVDSAARLLRAQPERSAA